MNQNLKEAFEKTKIAGSIAAGALDQVNKIIKINILRWEKKERIKNNDNTKNMYKKNKIFNEILLYTLSLNILLFKLANSKNEKIPITIKK